MMFLIFLTDWIKKEKLFVLSFFFFLIIKTSLLDRTLTYQPEMWAEGVTNYYLSAFTLGFWKSFLVLDFGYLPLWPRIVANFFYLFKPPSTLIPILYQSFSIVFICFSIASINLTRNNLLISSKYLRFFLSFLFCQLFDYELHTFINFSYWALIPTVFFISWLYFENVSETNLPPLNIKKKIFIVTFIIISVLSKPMTLALLPILVILFFRSPKNRIFSLLIISSLLLQLSIILLNAPKITAYNLPFNIFEFAQNLLAYVLIFPFFSLLDVNFITKSNYLLFAFITLVLFYFDVKQRKTNKNHIYLSIGLVFCSLFSLIITLKAYPKFFYISQFEAFPSSFLKTRLLFYSLVFNYFLIFIFLDTFIKKIYKTRAKIFYFVLITVFININNPAFNTKDRIKDFPYTHYSLFSLAQFPQDEECLPINPFPWLANTEQCNLLNFRQFSAFDEELMVLTLPYEFIVPSELLNKKIKYIHLLSKNHNDQTENSKNSIEINDSNNNIITVSPQIITDKIIRWKLPNPSKIIKINFKEIKSLSTVDKKPYVQLLGDPNEK